MHQATRRRHYGPRAHDIATRRAPVPVAEPATPEHIDWKVRVGDSVAHAFSSGPGWMRSVCRNERWTVTLQDAPDGGEICVDCALLTDGAPGEITESERRLLDGNR